MQEITSKDNEKIKILKKLNQKKYREKFSQFSVENLTIIKDAKKAGVDFESLFVTEEFLKKNKKDVDFISTVIPAPSLSSPSPEGNSKGGDPQTKTHIITNSINKSFSNLENPSGICAIYKKQEKKIDFNLPVIYINKITDPGNLGAIFRSAVAFSFKNIVLDEECADLYNPKTINSAKDAIFKLNIVFDEKLKTLKEIKKKMKVFSTSVESGKSGESLKKHKEFCLVLGNETRGVDKNIQKISDDFIKIEMSKEMESLNVAVSAGIIFHEFYKS
ncbi:MAG: RNA methyltransferase [Parcubacteria group bacterium]|nr:RNA methyltransferase [Parcubacteria group bacterium]